MKLYYSGLSFICPSRDFKKGESTAVTCQFQDFVAAVAGWDVSRNFGAKSYLVCLQFTVGNTDGCVEGRRYFCCEPTRGKFVRLVDIVKVLETRVCIK